MARPIANDRELSWHKGKRYWYRTVPVDIDKNGKEVRRPKTFGHGAYQSDRTSYNAALRAYRAYMHEWETRLALSTVAERIRSGVLGNSPLEEWLKANRPDVINQQVTDDQLADIEKRMRVRHGMHTAPKTDSSKQPTIADQIDMWLAYERQRVLSGNMSQSGISGKRNGIATFRDWCGKRVFEDPKSIEQMLGAYRIYMLGKLEAKQYMPNTINDKIKYVTQFIKWAYTQRILDESPRSLPAFSRKIPTVKGGQPLSVEQVRQIWMHANPRMKCFMALAINCGFKNMDICMLTGSDLSGDRLISNRSKTNAPMNYKLWPETLALLEATRQDRGEGPDTPVFRKRDGQSLTSGTLSGLFKKIAVRAGVTVTARHSRQSGYATFEMLRDSSAELLKQSLLEQGLDMGILQLFLAHKDSSTAAYYTSNDPHTLKSDKLDLELDRLCALYDFHADTPT